MNNELRDRFYGSTIEERLVQVPSELAIDAVGLWQVVSFGQQGFELTGDALKDYVRRHILALLEKGARPVVGAQGRRRWQIVEYGHHPEEIADAIIEEWLAKGGGSDPGGVWFALPHINESTPQS